MSGTSGVGVNAMKEWVRKYVTETLSQQAGGGGY